MWGLSPAHSKMGGRVPPPMAEPLMVSEDYKTFAAGAVARIEVTMLIIKPRYRLCLSGTLLGDHVNVFKHSSNSGILASAWNIYSLGEMGPRAIFQPASRIEGRWLKSVPSDWKKDWKFSSLVLLKSGKGSLRPGMGSKMPGMGPVRPGNDPLRTGMGLLRHVMGPFRPGRYPLKPGLIPLRPSKGPLIFGKASRL